MTFRLDRSGVSRFLRSPDMATYVEKVAQRAAEAARSTTDMPIEVRRGKTDRATAAVTVAHPGGQAAQAKNGTLTRAASAAGLTIEEQ